MLSNKSFFILPFQRQRRMGVEVFVHGRCFLAFLLCVQFGTSISMKSQISKWHFISFSRLRRVFFICLAKRRKKEAKIRRFEIQSSFSTFSLF